MPKAGAGFTAVTITKEVRKDLDMLSVLVSQRVGRRLTLGETITEALKVIEGLPRER